MQERPFQFAAKHVQKLILLDEKSFGKIGPGTTPIEVLNSRSNQGRLEKVKHSPPTIKAKVGTPLISYIY